ncbi:MAG: Trk system potassium transporter TrkA [Clostridia bacterium]|nr:Trk system potassium transporter TrkA [Clostridia bacterium]
MNIVIVGCGRVGSALVDQLSKEGHDLVVIDSNSALVSKLINDYDVKGICGNGANSDIQKEADVPSADLLVACTPLDELNILCCMVAKKLGTKEIIARVRNNEYFNLFLDNELGLSMMVNPEYESAMEIARILRFPLAIKVEPFADGKVELIEYRITADSPLVDVTLKDLGKTFEAKILVCAISREDKVFIPGGEFTLKANDKINITATPKDIYAFFKNIGAFKKRCKHVMMLGGSRISFYLAKQLRKIGINVKIIEDDYKQCLMLKENLDKADIIQANYTDLDVLIEEGLDNTDALIALSDNDETNVIISMFANNRKVRVITKLDNTSYSSMLDGIGIDTVISPKSLTANQIIRHVRGRQNSGGKVCTLYRIVNGKAEAIEFIANESFEQLSVPLKDITLKPNVIIASIIRDNATLIPCGEDTIEKNDRIIIVTTAEFFDELNDILE